MNEVRLERDGAVAVLVVDRPRARNAIAPATMRSLAETIEALAEQCAGDDPPRAVVLRGGGGRFVSGGDLKALDAHRTHADGRRIAEVMHAALGRLARLPIPVIAAVERFALGGGAELALACDLRVFGHDAVIGFRQVEFAVTSGWGGGRRLAERVGTSRALKLLWTGAELTAPEALRLGLADEVAPPGTTAVEAALALARRIAAWPGEAVGATKTLLVEGAALDDAAFAELAAETFARTWASEAHWQQVDAFWARHRARKEARAVRTEPESGRGRFIVLEGLDGAGTTTQARRLAEWLREQGREVVFTHEPSPGPIGTLIRQALSLRVVGADGERLDARSIALLFAADRRDHLAGEIEPALARGADVVCDRYVHSSLAYQGAENDPAWVAELNAEMRAPDLVLLLRVEVEVAAQRRAARAGKSEIYEVDDFQRRVAANYDAAARWRPDDPVVVVDGAGDPDTVFAACRAAVEAIDPHGAAG